MPRGSLAGPNSPEWETVFDPDSGHNHDGINSAPIGGGVPGSVNGTTITGGASQITIGPGNATGQNGNTITVTSPVLIDLAAKGEEPGGYDSNFIAAGGRPGAAPGEWYYIYLIKNPGTGVVSAIVSKDPNSPALGAPFDGFTIWRQIGVVLDEPPGAFTPFKYLADLGLFTFDVPQFILAPGPLPPPPGAKIPLAAPDTTPFVPPNVPLLPVELQVREVGPPSGFIITDADVPAPPTVGQIDNTPALTGGTFFKGRVNAIPVGPPTPPPLDVVPGVLAMDPGGVGSYDLYVTGFWL